MGAGHSNAVCLSGIIEESITSNVSDNISVPGVAFCLNKDGNSQIPCDPSNSSGVRICNAVNKCLDVSYSAANSHYESFKAACME